MTLSFLMWAPKKKMKRMERPFTEMEDCEWNRFKREDQEFSKFEMPIRHGE